MRLFVGLARWPLIKYTVKCHPNSLCSFCTVPCWIFYHILSWSRGPFGRFWELASRWVVMWETQHWNCSSFSEVNEGATWTAGWGVRHVGCHCFSFRAGILLTNSAGRNCMKPKCTNQNPPSTCVDNVCVCVLNLCDMQVQVWGCGIQNVVSDFVRRHQRFNETWNSEILGVSFLWGNCRTCKKHTS